ncbi:hypothetical protein ACJJID_17730 [Microbulbifer sp. CnH-101-G]|uniref:hypothetical protein n=1 Tax=Microbulbifer sp. CnH-101-G TaxID=3243393 RepID=UPI0040392206
MENREISSGLGDSREKKSFFSSKKIQGISIIASVLLPMVAAYIVFYTGLGVPSGTVNQGELLQPPINIKELKVSSFGSQVPLLGNDSQKWRYLILDGSDCNEACEKLLYTSRQVHIRLGEKANRVERFLITDESMTHEKQKKLQIDHPRLKVLRLNESSMNTLQALTAHQNIDETRAILIDQDGFAMMVYDNQHSGNQLLKDIKRLLKYSYEK